MLNSDVEQKITNYVKNSPLGVTSADIAKELGLNRMTIAKYLAVTKEKALIDFKRLGMAKLWYVPVTLNKEVYFNDMIIDIVAGDPANVKKAALAMAKRVDEMYKRFHGVDKLNYNQVVDSLIDAQRKIGGCFVFAERHEDLIVLKNTKCPFGERVKQADCLCAMTSALCGVMAARNLGYSKVVLKRTIAKGSTDCLIYIYLKKTEDSDKETEEYSGV